MDVVAAAFQTQGVVQAVFGQVLQGSFVGQDFVQKDIAAVFDALLGFGFVRAAALGIVGIGVYPAQEFGGHFIVVVLAPFFVFVLRPMGFVNGSFGFFDFALGGLTFFLH